MRKVRGNTFGKLIQDYTNSPEFASIAPGTQQLWARLLNFAAAVLGDLRLEQVRPKVLRDYINKFPEHPGKQRNTLTALRALESWAAIEADVTHHMTKGIKFAKLEGGHIPWTVEQVIHAEAYCREDLGRAIALYALTGQRGSDVVKMCWNDIATLQDGSRWIQVRQQKTGRELGCFILPELDERLARWPRSPGTILKDIWGKPFRDRHALSELWIKERARNPHLSSFKDLHLHGLRGHYCVRLYQGGMTTRDVSQTVGMSLQMVEHYCRLSDQKKNVSAAILRFSDFKPLKSLDPPISMT